MNIHILILHGSVFSTLFHIHLGEGLLGDVLVECLILVYLPNHFSKQLYHFTSLLSKYECSPFSSPMLIRFIVCLSDYKHPSGCEVIFHCHFDLCFQSD